LDGSTHVQGIHDFPNISTVSSVIYEEPKEGEMISMEDIWTTNPSWQLLPTTRKVKKGLTTGTLLDEEAIDLLLHCPSNQETHVYVNGMSGELSLL